MAGFADSPARQALTRAGALRVPEITALFWVVKLLSTALGESTSDYLVHIMNPFVAVFLGFVGFCAALAIQLSRRRYIAWTYWLAVAAVGVFGTMAADALHVGAGVPYIASTVLYALILTAVFVTWWRTEHTLSIHAIDTARREIFYWLAVGATFAMGTALGDLTAYTLHLGYLSSAVLFAGIICIPVVGYRWLGWNPVLAFWFAYVMTRPLGASLADFMAKPTSVSGLGWGDGPVAAGLAIAMFVLVAYLAVTKADVQQPTERRLVARAQASTDVQLPTERRLVGGTRVAPDVHQPTAYRSTERRLGRGARARGDVQAPTERRLVGGNRALSSDERPIDRRFTDDRATDYPDG